MTFLLIYFIIGLIFTMGVLFITIAMHNDDTVGKLKIINIVRVLFMYIILFLSLSILWPMSVAYAIYHYIQNEKS